MRRSKPRLVYLAGPIDLDLTDNRLAWRNRAAAMLAEHEICAYSPAAAFYWTGSTEGAEKVVRINSAALKESDAVLVYLNSQQTVGTMRELQQIVDWKKPVVLWIPDDAYERYKKSLYLASFKRCGTLEQAIETLATTKLEWLVVRE
jgi:nucleoside 2-deoxyribosyltransferase